MGIRYLISISAAGSLREDLKPLDIVLPDQFIDLTKRRDSSFFGNGAVAHVSMAQPICDRVANALLRATDNLKLSEPIQLHQGGT
jgi:5'-methylthioadenosine phosphorylase